MEKISCSTADLAVENAKKLIGLFPECEGERGTVDFDKLRQVLSSTVVEGNVERYEFTWPGKRKAMAAASAATTKTLRPCVEESVGKDGTKGGFDSENLYIEGDNLEALKLLQCNYAGKVKMIYIDPPYNTGHDFVYRDRFSLTDKELAQEGGAFDEDGNRFEKNDSAESRYHSNWCSMMYPRLKLARNLLRDDGVLFMSIDDNEVVNARKILDEVFGGAAFIANICHKARASVSNDKIISANHNHVLWYCKNREIAEMHRKEIGLDPDLEGFNRDDNDGRGSYRLVPVDGPGGAKKGNPYYEFLGVAQYYRFSQETMQRMFNEGLIVKVGDAIQQKYYLSKAQKSRRTDTTWWEDAGLTSSSTAEVKKLMDGAVFDNPKPVSLLVRILKLTSYFDKESLILDFFSGSATTAHAVMKFNAEDGGNRKFIMVQLPDQCSEDSEAAKAGYKNICEIGKERIRRAGKKIREELAAKNAEKTKDSAPDLFRQDLQDSQDLSKSNLELDVGFRVLKLDSSSLNDTSATVSETVQEFTNFDRIKSDRSSEDLLFQILLETRIPLSESIVKVKVGANEVFLVGVGELSNEGIGELASVGGVPLVACLDQKAKLDNEFFIELAKLKPEIVFFRDDAFTTDSARINVEQIFRQNSPSSAVKVI